MRGKFFNFFIEILLGTVAAFLVVAFFKITGLYDKHHNFMYITIGMIASFVGAKYRSKN